MIEILKYQLPSEPGPFQIEIPAFSKVVSIAVQEGLPVIWCEVGRYEAYSYHFYAVMTGQSFEQKDHDRFIGTALLDDGRFVLHYYSCPKDGRSVLREA